LSVAGGGSRVASGREGEEERVAVGADLDTTVALHRGPHQAAMLAEHGGEPRPVLVKQARRALDVGEQHRDGAARQRPRRRARLQGGVLAQDRRVQFAQLGTRLDSELVDEGKCLDRMAVAQGSFDGSLERAHAQLVEPPDLGCGERFIRDVGERRPTPES